MSTFSIPIFLSRKSGSVSMVCSTSIISSLGLRLGIQNNFPIFQSLRRLIGQIKLTSESNLKVLKYNIYILNSCLAQLVAHVGQRLEAKR